MNLKNAIFIIVILMIFLLIFSMDAIYAKPGPDTGQKLEHISQAVHVELLSDGTMNSTTISRAINISEKILHEYTFMSSINTLKAVLDKEGNELEFSVEEKSNIFKFTVQLKNPVGLNEELTIKTVDKNRKILQRQDGMYIYSNTHIPGPDLRFSEEIRIHPELELVWFSPKPSQTTSDKQGTVLSYTYDFKAGEAFQVRILCKPKEKDEMQIKVNPTIELFSLIHHLIGDNQYNEGLLPEYLEEVDRYFSPFKDHPAVKFAQECRTQHQINGDAPMALAVTIGPPPSLEPRIDLTHLPEGFDPRWDPNLIRDYLEQARSFAVDSRFMEFHDQHKYFHEQAVANLKDMLTKEHFFQWYHDFFGYIPEHFNLYIGLLNGSCNYGYALILPQGQMESVSILGARRPDSKGAPTYPKSWFLLVIIHEFCHSYINPLTISQPELFKELGESLLVSHRNRMTQMGYNVWNVILNEYMVRACTIRFLMQYEGQRTAAQWMERDKKGGFFAIEGLVKLLEQYEKQRNKYPDIKSFLPQVKKYFESYLAGSSIDSLKGGHYEEK